MTVKYFWMGSARGNAGMDDLQGNVARVIDRAEYAYLDHKTGEWVRHARVFDEVNFEAATNEITLKQEKTMVRRLAAKEPEWIDAAA